MKSKKQKFVFVLGEKYEAEQEEFFDRYIWGNKRGYHYGYFDEQYGCYIVKYLLEMDIDDYRELRESVDTAPNWSAILPLEVDLDEIYGSKIT